MLPEQIFRSLDLRTTTASLIVVSETNLGTSDVAETTGKYHPLAVVFAPCANDNLSCTRAECISCGRHLQVLGGTAVSTISKPSY